MRIVVYTLIRVGLILAAGVILYLAGMRSWLLGITAILVGAMISFLLLRRQTAEFSQSLTGLRARRGARQATQAEQDAAAEDALLDTPLPPGAPGSESLRRDQGDGQEEAVDEDQQPRP